MVAAEPTKVKASAKPAKIIFMDRSPSTVRSLTERGEAAVTVITILRLSRAALRLAVSSRQTPLELFALPAKYIHIDPGG
jgi:hypothetical protein